MLLVLLLDPHWEGLSDLIFYLFLTGIVLPVVAWLLLRVDKRREHKRTETTSRAWSTKRATIAVVAVVLLMLLLQMLMQ
jgi:heme/copper-type cytochrome/quinol oxidase subunit 2